MSLPSHSHTATVHKPTVAAKPKHLQKSKFSAPSAADHDLELPKTVSDSLQHMTPKVWSKSPSLKTPHDEKLSADHHMTSPFSKGKWRPMPQVQPKPGARKQQGTENFKKNYSVEGKDINLKARVQETLNQKDQTLELHEHSTSLVAGGKNAQATQTALHKDANPALSAKDFNESRVDQKTKLSTETNRDKSLDYPPKVLLKPRLSGTRPRVNIQHRESCRRDTKSPGFGTLVKMFDHKVKAINVDVKIQETDVQKPRASTQGDTWKHVTSSQKQTVTESNSNNDLHATPRRRASSSINYQSPKPYFSRASSKKLMTVALVASDASDDHAFTFDETSVKKYSQEASGNAQKSDKEEPMHPCATNHDSSIKEQQSELVDQSSAIYDVVNDDSNIHGLDVGTYGEFEESDEEVTSAIYSLADDVTCDCLEEEAPAPLQGYLAMSGSQASLVEINYEEMKSEVDLPIPEVNYMAHIVPPPASIKSVPEYHEIDPNVPPPPDREPPKLPPDVRGQVSNTGIEEEPADPPPLPPDNTVGRRSMMLSKERQKIVVKEINDKVVVNKGKKLNYIEVEVAANDGKNFTKATFAQRTNYSDVVILSDSDIPNRERSGSGTSDEGLTSTKQKNKVKQKLQSLFSSDAKGADKQQDFTVDFDKERNKKKRISGRFLRKNKKMDKTKESNHGSVMSRSFDSDSGVADTDVRSSSTTTSSSGGSAQSSGDGEIKTKVDDRAWKVLPTSSDRRRSHEVPHLPQALPRESRTYKKTASQPDLSLAVSVYNEGDQLSVTSNESEKRKVSSFLHGGPSDSQLEPLRPLPRSLPRSQVTELPTVPPPLSTSLPIPYRPGPTSPPPPRPPKSNAMFERSPNLPKDPPPLPPQIPPVGSYEEEDAPPPVPDRDPIDQDAMYGATVPPSPFGRHGSSNFLQSEPLYQIYRNRTMSHASARRRAPQKRRESEESNGEWKSELLNEELGTSTLWRSIPEIAKSGIADEMKPEEIKLQQAQFEVITSQASYIRSLNILISHFMEDTAMESTAIIPNSDRKILFSNILAVRHLEQKFLQDLEKHFWQHYTLSKVCDIIAQYAKSDFDVYVLYIQNQVYQDRVLTKLQRNNDRFSEELQRLETSPACNKLPLLSFLMLPMQRVTRLPLLVSAIVHAADSANNTDIFKKSKHTLGVVNKLVKKCNEGARKMQQTEQLAEIAAQLDYAHSVKMFALVSQSRSLVKKGEMMVTMATDSKKGGKTSKLWLFLFSDVLFIARKKSFMESGNTRYEVVDWAKRNLLYVNEKAVSDSAIFLVLLEDQASKRVELTLIPGTQNELSRWTDALSPPNTGSTGESIYEVWDCPQFTCVTPYVAEQPDELSIDVNDVMQVLKKTSDGWLEGQRLRDGETGWFPSSRCDEIEDEHVRARNMKNLYKTYVS